MVPERSRSILTNRPDSPSAGGAVSEELWVYIGPGDAPPSPGDSVEQGVLSLTAREVKALYWQDEVLYHWALLGRRKEAAT
mgnify:CR=1 FL=1